MIHYIQATDDRLYIIVSEKTPEDDNNFYLVSLDIKTGEAYEKIQLETNKKSIHHQNVYNNKYSFFLLNEDEKRLFYVFSGDDVNRPLEE